MAMEGEWTAREQNRQIAARNGIKIIKPAVGS